MGNSIHSQGKYQIFHPINLVNIIILHVSRHLMNVIIYDDHMIAIIGMLLLNRPCWVWRTNDLPSVHLQLICATTRLQHKVIFLFLK